MILPRLSVVKRWQKVLFGIGELTSGMSDKRYPNQGGAEILLVTLHTAATPAA